MLISPEDRGELEGRLQRAGLASPLITGKGECISRSEADLYELIDQLITTAQDNYGVAPKDRIAHVLMRTEDARPTSMQLRNGHRYIVITTGCLARLQTLAAWYEAGPEKSRSIFRAKPMRPTLSAEGLSVGAPPTHITAEQEELATLLAHSGVSFLALHELMHHINGHFSIHVSERPDDDERLTSQALEYDADAGAAKQCLWWLSVSLRALHPTLSSADVARRAISVVMAAAYLTISFGNEPFSFNHDVAKRMKHPPHFHRWVTVVSTLDAVIDETPGMAEALPAQRGRLLVVSDYVRDKLFAVADPAQMGASNLNMTGFSELTRRIRRRYAALYPTLSRAKLGNHNLAPPAAEPG